MIVDVRKEYLDQLIVEVIKVHPDFGGEIRDLGKKGSKLVNFSREELWDLAVLTGKLDVTMSLLGQMNRNSKE